LLLLIAWIASTACLANAAPESLRVVSLAPSITETLFAVGAGGDLVGVSDFCDHPPEVGQIARAGSYLRPNVEAIVAMRPDLVIAVPSPGNREDVAQLSRLGLEILVVAEGPTVEHVFEAMRTIATAVGREERGRELVRRIARELDEIRRRVADRPRPRVLMLVGRNPLVAVGRPNLIDEVLGLVNAENLAAGHGVWPRLSLELVVREQPDVLLDGSMGGEALADDGFFADLGLDAVARRRVHALRLDEILRPGPRLAEGARRLASVVHPEAFPPSEPAR
jgi:iron complex transport system substrate-binding protein